jgi:peptide/nickel transport system ATP-binding protein/oligopeptide transport system ATP-binding protein
MYLGKIVEIADRFLKDTPTPEIYTQALLSAVPDVKQAAVGGRHERIRLEGDVPSPINPPSGCRFRTRCWMAQDICAKAEPPLLQIGRRHKMACHFAGEFGAHPAIPITLSALGVDGRGPPTPGATPSTEDLNRPGFAETWTDVETHQRESAAMVGEGGTGAQMTDEQRGEGGTHR